MPRGRSKVRSRAQSLERAQRIVGIEPRRSVPVPGAPSTSRGRNDFSAARATGDALADGRPRLCRQCACQRKTSAGRAIHPTRRPAVVELASPHPPAGRVRRIADAACVTGAPRSSAPRSPKRSDAADAQRVVVARSGRRNSDGFSCRRSSAAIRKCSVDERDENKKSMPLLSDFPMRYAPHRARSTALRVRARPRKVAQFCANRAEIGPTVASAENFFSSLPDAAGRPRRRRARRTRIVRA